MKVKEHYKIQVIKMSDRDLLKELLYLRETILRDREFDLGYAYEELTKSKLSFCKEVIDSRIIYN